MSRHRKWKRQQAALPQTPKAEQNLMTIAVADAASVGQSVFAADTASVEPSDDLLPNAVPDQLPVAKTIHPAEECTGFNPMLRELQSDSPHAGEVPAAPAAFSLSLAAQPLALSDSLGFQPFPVDCLAGPIRRFVVEYAQAMNCDASFLALPVLTVLAAMVGNTRRIQLKSAWTEPPILWTAVVAESGTRKSPPLDIATSPLWEKQMSAFDRHNYRPVELTADRYVVSDLAVETLAVLLSRQPRGLLVCRDELDGWLSGFDASRSRQGAGPAQWLELHGGRPMLVDRGSGIVKTTLVRAASVCVTGGIQPAILSARLTKSQLSSGLFARLLFAYPPVRTRQWRDADVDDRVYLQYGKVLNRLFELDFGQCMDGSPAARWVKLSPQARQRFSRFVNEFEQQDVEPALTASFAKLEGYAARFALVLHLTRWASDEDVDPEVCDETSMQHGITLSYWFANEARRVHAMLCESPEEAVQRKLIEWLQRRGGGQVRVRDLVRSSGRRYGTAELATAALDQLVTAGWGFWKDQPTDADGGRPCRVFQLSVPVPGGSESGGCVGHDLPNDHAAVAAVV